MVGENKVQINKFFDSMKDWIRLWKLEYAPNSIWNVDECGLGDVPKSQKVVGVTGECPFMTVADEKAKNTTLLNFISTGGVAMMPMIIFKNAAIKKNGERQPLLATCLEHPAVDTSTPISSSSMVKSLSSS